MAGGRGARFVGSIRLGALLPSSHHPAASQSTPYNLNRYTLLAIYLFYTAINSCLILGSKRFSTMLYRSKAFLWTCLPEEQQLQAGEAEPACVRQETNVHRLFIASYAARLISVAIAGVLTDVAGPKVTALLGQVMSVCGWTLLGASTASFRSLIPSFLLIGLGRGMSFLPMLCISNLFPGGVGFSLTLMGAASGISILIPHVLDAANESGCSFRWVCWIYTLLGPLSGLLIIIFFVPLEGFLDEDRYVFVRSRRVAPHPFSAAEEADTAAAPPPSQSALISQHTLSMLAVQSVSEAGGGALQHASRISTLTDEAFFQAFHEEACTFLYFALGVYFTICNLAIVCYQQAATLVALQLRDGVTIAAGVSLVPCFVLGRLTDFCPVVNIMMLINLCGALSFCFALIKTASFGTLSLCFFSVYVALSQTQVYIYIKRQFTSVHFGKLVGLVYLMGGVASLCSNVFPNWQALHESAHNAYFVVFVMVGLLIAAYVLLVPMAVLAKRKRKRLEQQRVMRLPTVYSAAQTITMSSTSGQRSNCSASINNN